MISVKGLSKIYRVRKVSPGLAGRLSGFLKNEYEQVQALEEVSFEIAKGECVGYIGPNGAGKSTTLKILSGVMHPTAGRCSVAGHTPWKRERKLLRRLSFFAGQKGQLVTDLPPMDSYKFLAAVYELDQRVAVSRATEYAEILGVRDLLGKPVRLLSLGQKMKFELIGAFLHRPDVVFMDEPTLGLDLWAQVDVYNCLTQLNKLNGSTIILTSHHMADIERLCQRVILLSGGRVLSDGSISALRASASDFRKIKAVAASEADLDALGGLFSRFGPSIDRESGAVSALLPLADLRSLRSEALKYTEHLDVEEEPLSDLIRRIYRS